MEPSIETPVWVDLGFGICLGAMLLGLMELLLGLA
jgi:hypothetical protein